MQEIDNIFKISKSIKLLVKMNNMSFILWKKLKLNFLANMILFSNYYARNQEKHK